MYSRVLLLYRMSNSNRSIVWEYVQCSRYQHTLWMYHKPPYKPIPKHTMIEVTHVTDAFPGQSKLETVGSWMYKATGSGIYFNTGNTISFQDPSEAARYF